MHDATAHNRGDAGHDICDRGDVSLHQLPQRPDAVPSRPAFVEIGGRRRGGNLIKKITLGVRTGVVNSGRCWRMAAKVGGDLMEGSGGAIVAE